MPNEKKPKTKCVEYLRHAEYYDMQSTFDELYARGQAGEIFENLMDVILSRENILLAYRNIKSNTGSIRREQTSWRFLILVNLPLMKSQQGYAKSSRELKTATPQEA